MKAIAGEQSHLDKTLDQLEGQVGWMGALRPRGHSGLVPVFCYFRQGVFPIGDFVPIVVVVVMRAWRFRPWFAEMCGRVNVATSITAESKC